MESKSALFYRVLLDHFHEGFSESTLSFLQEEEVKQILERKPRQSDIKLPFIPSKNFIKKVHYSWLRTIVRDYPPEMQQYMINSLPEPHRTRLLKAFLPKQAPKTFPPVVKSFFMSDLSQKLFPPEVIPSPYIEESKLSFLADLNKNELVDYVDYLSLYDLAIVIRNIVDQRLLKLIYQSLSISQQNFLKKCLTQKKKLTTAKIGFDKWRGDIKHLKNILHTRGLIRLGGALTAEEKGLVWHISHTFDTGRGSILKRYSETNLKPEIVKTLVLEVLTIKNYLEKKR